MPLFLAKASVKLRNCQLQALKILEMGAKIEWYWLRYDEDFFFFPAEVFVLSGFCSQRVHFYTFLHHNEFEQQVSYMHEIWEVYCTPMTAETRTSGKTINLTSFTGELPMLVLSWGPSPLLHSPALLAKPLLWNVQPSKLQLRGWLSKRAPRNKVFSEQLNWWKQLLFWMYVVV